MENHYAALGVERSSSAEAVRAAYRRLALRHHPDRRGCKDGGARFRRVVAAYALLGNPDMRAAYDAGLRCGTGLYGGGECNEALCGGVPSKGATAEASGRSYESNADANLDLNCKEGNDLSGHAAPERGTTTTVGAPATGLTDAAAGANRARVVRRPAEAATAAECAAYYAERYMTRSSAMRRAAAAVQRTVLSMRRAAAKGLCGHEFDDSDDESDNIDRLIERAASANGRLAAEYAASANGRYAAECTASANGRYAAECAASANGRYAADEAACLRCERASGFCGRGRAEETTRHATGHTDEHSGNTPTVEDASEWYATHPTAADHDDDPKGPTGLGRFYTPHKCVVAVDVKHFAAHYQIGGGSSDGPTAHTLRALADLGRYGTHECSPDRACLATQDFHSGYYALVDWNAAAAIASESRSGLGPERAGEASAAPDAGRAPADDGWRGSVIFDRGMHTLFGSNFSV